MANDSFSGTTIQVSYKSGNVEIARSVDISVVHIPGGTTSYIDIGGPKAPTIMLDLFFATSALYMSFRTLLYTQGILKLMQNSTTPEQYTAVLADLKRTAIGLSTAGETEAQAQFIVVSE